jgi:AcrR family transcriptional regulator
MNMNSHSVVHFSTILYNAATVNTDGGRKMTDGQTQKREKILKAAGKVFAAKGYEHSSIRDIALEAKVADGTIYNYFKNKEDLMHSLIAGLISSLGSAESEALGLNAKTSLEARTLKRMERLQKSYEEVAAVLPVILGARELRKSFRKEYIEPVLSTVEKEMSCENPALSSRMLMAAVLGFQVLLLLGDETTKRVWSNQSELAPLWVKVIKAVNGK